ncbi:MAG: hypothetical protein ACU0A6_12810 [Shimia sp.]|jgi:hypothetical protein|uniref:hypothetical protein n=1 Tax=Shimia sp. TaxID=1954381 RepID=UPI004059C6E2
MPAYLFLMWTLPLHTTPAPGKAKNHGTFFWATTKAGARSDLILDVTADNLNKAPVKRQA